MVTETETERPGSWKAENKPTVRRRKKRPKNHGKRERKYMQRRHKRHGERDRKGKETKVEVHSLN